MRQTVKQAGLQQAEIHILPYFEKFPAHVLNIVEITGVKLSSILEKMNPNELHMFTQSSMKVSIKLIGDNREPLKNIEAKDVQILYKELFLMCKKERMMQAKLAIRIILLNICMGKGGTGMSLYKTYLLNALDRDTIERYMQSEGEKMNLGDIAKHLIKSFKRGYPEKEDKRSGAANDSHFHIRTKWQIRKNT